MTLPEKDWYTFIVETEKERHQRQLDLQSVLQEVDLRFYLPGF